MNIIEIYEKYKIHPHLQMHMLRVAAVGKLICQNMKIATDENAVVVACLLHDMGNIIKFSMKFRAELFEPEGVEYWQAVKDEYIEKYGDNEHHATEKIMQEIGVSQKVIDVFHLMGFSHSDITLASDSIEAKIANYSDQRVGPDGVLPLLDRLNEARGRFLANKNEPDDPAFFDMMMGNSVKIETEIFDVNGLRPSDISDKSIAIYVDELRRFEV